MAVLRGAREIGRLVEPASLRPPARLAGGAVLRTQSDHRLVELARAGSEPAFGAIVERYRGPDDAGDGSGPAAPASGADDWGEGGDDPGEVPAPAGMHAPDSDDGPDDDDAARGED